MIRRFPLPVIIISGGEQNIMAAVKFDYVERLARDLHEAARDAVLANKVVKKDGAPLGEIKFLSWDEITEDAREGRRIMARFLLARYWVFPKDQTIFDFTDTPEPTKLYDFDGPGHTSASQ